MSAMTKKEWMEYLEKTWDAAQREAWSEPQFECPRCGHCCPPQPERKWVGLTNQEIEEMHNEIKVRLMGTYRTEDIYRSIEAKLREKNT